MAKFDIRWDAPEFEPREKGVSWYWISIIIVAIIVAFAIYEKDFLFGFFMVVAEILLIVWGNREPQMVHFRLTDERLSVGEDEEYHVNEFESWSTDELGSGRADLVFYYRSRVKPPLQVIAPAADIPSIREHLKPLLREIEHQRSFIDSIEKLLHF